MYDACRGAADRIGSGSDVLARLGVRGRPFDIATVHRAENVDSRDRLRRIIEYLVRAAEDREIVFPVHPRTREALLRFDVDAAPLQLCDPLGYIEMAALLANCTTVFTDSGGLQKEAYFYGKPCVTLRDETEWVETVESGWNRLWRGPDYARRCEIAEYGDGHAADRIADLIREYSRRQPEEAPAGTRPDQARADQRELR